MINVGIIKVLKVVIDLRMRIKMKVLSSARR